MGSYVGVWNSVSSPGCAGCSHGSELLLYCKGAARALTPKYPIFSSTSKLSCVCFRRNVVASCIIMRRKWIATHWSCSKGGLGGAILGFNGRLGSTLHSAVQCTVHCWMTQNLHSFFCQKLGHTHIFQERYDIDNFLDCFLDLHTLHSGMFPEILCRCENVGRQSDFANFWPFLTWIQSFFKPIEFF